MTDGIELSSRDAPRPFDKMSRCVWWTKLIRRPFEQGKPTIEMLTVDEKAEIGLSSDHDSGQTSTRLMTKIVKLADIGVPIGDSSGEDRTKDSIRLHPSIKALHEALNHHSVDSGPNHDLAGETRARSEPPYAHKALAGPPPSR